VRSSSDPVGGANLGPRETSIQVFQALDTDGNDKLSFREFVLGMNVTSTGTNEDKLRSLKL